MNEPLYAEADLHAWVDGELPEERRQCFEEALARDPALAARAADIERQNRWLQRGLEPILHEPVPQRLLDAALGRAAEGGFAVDRQTVAGRRAPVAPPAPAGRLASTWRRAAPWMRFAMAAQLAAIVVLGTVVAWKNEPVAAYRTLGSAAVPAGSQRIAVVFDPKITEGEMRRIVRVAGARIVDGPTQADAYVLAVAPDQAAAALAMLGSQRSVLFVASMGAPPRP